MFDKDLKYITDEEFLEYKLDCNKRIEIIEDKIINLKYGHI